MSIAALFNDPNVYAAAEADNRVEDFETARDLFNCLISPEAIEKTLDIAGLGKIGVRILIQEDLPKKVGIIRNGMMITDSLKHFGEGFQKFPLYNDFVALVEPLEGHGSALIKTLESPRHDELSADYIPDSAKAAAARAAMVALGKKVRETIKSETKVDHAEEVAIDEMSEFFADQAPNVKFSDEMRFAHPILSHVTADFGDKEFNVSIVAEERPSNGYVRLECESSVTDPDIESCIKSGKAAVGLFVTSPETYYNQLQQLPLGKGTLEFPNGLLHGRVTLRPVIWLTETIRNWKPKNLHPEFGSDPLEIAKSKLLGVGREQILSVGHDKLAPMESIFHLAKKLDLQDGEVVLDLDGPKIKILVNEKTFESVNIYRGKKQGRAVVLNGLYLPAVMEVLRSLSGNAQSYEGYKWYAPFMAKCVHFGIDTADAEPLEHAQILLARPLDRLVKEQERLLP